MRSKQILIVIVAIALIAISSCIYFILSGRTELKEKELNALISENIINEKRNIFLREQIKSYPDSLKRLKNNRLNATVFVEDEMIVDADKESIRIGRNLKRTWLGSIFSLGFDAVDTVIVASDCSEGDMELWDKYGIAYRRIFDGRSVTVTANYNCKKISGGREIPEDRRYLAFDESFTIKFSSKDDLDYFVQSLRDINYVKKAAFNPYSYKVEEYFYQSQYNDTTSLPIINSNDTKFTVSDSVIFISRIPAVTIEIDSLAMSSD